MIQLIYFKYKNAQKELYMSLLTWKSEGLRITKMFLKNEIKSRKLAHLEIRTYYKAVVIKAYPIRNRME